MNDEGLLHLPTEERRLAVRSLSSLWLCSPKGSPAVMTSVWPYMVVKPACGIATIAAASVVLVIGAAE